MDKNQAYFAKSCQLFSSRLVHILVHARTGTDFSRRCSPTFNESDHFSLRIEELGEVAAFLKENIQNYPPVSRQLTVDFLLCIDGCCLPMESWCVSVSDAGSVLDRSFDLLDQNGEMLSSFDSVRFCSEISNVLKASMAAARATPMFRYFVKKPESERHIVLYRVSEGPPVIELGEGRRHYRIGSICTPCGNISLDVSYRVEFQTCKTSCCSRDSVNERSLKRQASSSKRSLEDEGRAYFPFQPTKRSSVASDLEMRNATNAGDRKSSSSSSEQPSLRSTRSASLSGGSDSVSDRVPFCDKNFMAGSTSSVTVEDPVPFLALLTASMEDNFSGQSSSLRGGNSSSSGDRISASPTSASTDSRSCLKEKNVPKKNAKRLSFADTKRCTVEETIYESAASTIVFSQSENSSGQDQKSSNYSFLSSDEESETSQTDNTSDTSFIKVPFSFLPTGDPSNVGDFILFLRRCEMQEFAFSFDRTDLLIQELAKFETRRHSFDRFLADITETVEV